MSSACNDNDYHLDYTADDLEVLTVEENMSGIKTKLWVGIGAFVLAGAQVDLPAANGPAKVSFGNAFAANPSPHASHGKQGGEGGEGGEGGKKKLNASERKIDFLKNLSLVQGHLIAGQDLYKAGAKEAAETHMKHPSDELYGKLASGFKEYNAPRFDPSLKKMAAAVEQGKSPEEVDQAFQTVRADIERTRNKVQPSLKARLLTASQVMREAGAEFAEGVKDGKVVNPHEYQDAYGFVQASLRLIDGAKPANAAQKTAVEQARQAIGKLDGTWSTLTGDEAVKTASSEIHAAASQIELAASGLK